MRNRTIAPFGNLVQQIVRLSVCSAKIHFIRLTQQNSRHAKRCRVSGCRLVDQNLRVAVDVGFGVRKSADLGVGLGDLAIGERVRPKHRQLVVVELQQGLGGGAPFPGLPRLVSHDVGRLVDIEAGVDLSGDAIGEQRQEERGNSLLREMHGGVGVDTLVNVPV